MNGIVAAANHLYCEKMSGRPCQRALAEWFESGELADWFYADWSGVARVLRGEKYDTSTT